MGLDIYLKWNEQTPNEKQAQYCGWAINNGHNGYLRASWSMREEIELYSDVLHGKWSGLNDDEPIAFDFLIEKNREKLEQQITKYLESMPSKHLEFAEVIVKSVRDFYSLGELKQKEGKEPVVVFA